MQIETYLSVVKNSSKKQLVKSYSEQPSNTYSINLSKFHRIIPHLKEGNPHSCHDKHYAAEILVTIVSSIKRDNSDWSHNT